MTSKTMIAPEEMERWLDGGQAADPLAPVARPLDEVFKEGPSPSAWKAAKTRLQERLGSLGTPIHYEAIPETPVGKLWVAVSERGLVGVSFGGREAEFAEGLSRRTGRTVIRSDQPTAEARRQIQAYLEGRRRDFSVEVDLRFVTPFQRQVLAAARAVPRGQVATYGQIARRIGRPRAARAIGQALGGNPIPIVVPCHRVLASDGSLGGYSGPGGIRTKRRLLQLEGAVLPI